MNFELNPEQILILGVVASALVLVLRLVIELMSKKKITLPSWVQNVIVFAVALVLALLWMPTTLPPLPVPTGDPSIDVPAYSAMLVSALSALVAALAFAVFIYNYLGKLVKEKLGQSLMPALYRPK